MVNKYGIPLKQYHLLSELLYQDKEKYTKYGTDQMPNMVVFDDLVRTLMINPDLYHRPIVELEDYGYMVKGNNIFFEAGLKAGLKSFICDVNIRTFDDRHTSQFLVMDVTPEQQDYQLHKIFFVQTHSGNNVHEGHVRQFNLKLSECGFDKNVFFESNKSKDIIELKITHDFDEDKLEDAIKSARRIVTGAFEIRSINGLIERP